MTNTNQSDKIKCPKCNALIPITETLQHQLTEAVRKEYKGKMEEQKKIFSKQRNELAEKEKALEEKSKDMDEKIQEGIKKELEVQGKILF